MSNETHYRDARGRRWVVTRDEREDALYRAALAGDGRFSTYVWAYCSTLPPLLGALGLVPEAPEARRPKRPGSPTRPTGPP